MRKLRWIAGSLFILIVLFVVCIRLLESARVRRLVAGELIAALRQQGMQVELRSLDYSILGLYAVADGVTIRSSSAPSLPPIVTVERVRLRMNAARLLRGSYWVESAEVDAPEVHLVRKTGGMDNVPRLPPRNPPAEPSSVLIQSLTVNDGSLRVEDEERRLSVSLPGWEARVSGDPSLAHEIQFSARRTGELSYDGRRETLKSLTARVLARKDGLVIRAVNFQLPDAELKAAGTVQPLSAPLLNLSIEASAVITPLARFAGLGHRLAGAAQTRLMITGPAANPVVRGSLSASEFGYHPYLRGVSLEAGVRYDGAARRLQIGPVGMRSSALALSGNVDLALRKGASRASIHLSRADLGELSAAFSKVRITGNARGSLRASWEGLAAEAATAEGSFSIQRGMLARDAAPVSGAVRLKARQGGIELAIAPLEIFGARLEGSAALDARRRLSGRVTAAVSDVAQTRSDWNVFSGQTPGASFALAGPAEATADLAGTLDAPEVVLGFTAPGTAIGGLKDVALRLSAAYSRHSVRVDEAEAAWHGQSIRGQGVIRFNGESPSLDFHLRLPSASIEGILAGLNRPAIPLRGAIEGEAAISGDVSKPRGTVTLVASNLVAYGESFGELAVRASADGAAVRLDQLRLDKGAPGQILEANGVYDLSSRRISLSATGRNLTIDHLTPPGGEPLRAILDLTAACGGTIDNPEATSRLRIREARYGAGSIGSIDVQLSAANQRIGAILDAPGLRLHAGVTAGMNNPYPVDARIEASGVQIETLPLLREKLKGTLSGVIRGSGNLSDWRNGAASAEFDSVSFEVAGQRVRNDGPLKLSYRNGALQAEHAVLVSSQSRLELAGAFPSQLGVKGTIDLATIGVLFPGQEAKASGRLTVEGGLLGTWKKLEPAVDFQVADATIAAAGMPPVSHLSLRGRIRNGTVTGELNARWASGSITSSGEAPLGLFPLPDAIVRKQGPATLSLQIKDVDPASLPGVPSGVGGAVSLRLDAEAPRADPASVTGRLRIEKLQLRAGDVSVRQSGVSSIRIENGIARIEELSLTGSGAAIRLSGTAGLTGERPLALKAEGAFNAAIAAALSEGFKLQGPSRLQLAASGALAKPVVTGFLETDNATLAIASPRLAIENLKARVDIQGALVRLTRLSGVLNGGALTAAGRLRYQNGFLNDVNLGVKAGNVYLDFPQGLRTISSADLNLHGTGERMEVSGQVTVEEGSYKEPLTLQGGLLQYIRSGQDARAGMARGESLLSKIEFRIGLNTAQPLLIDNNIARVNVSARLKLLGDYTRPGMTGRVTIDEGGQLMLNERGYSVERGVITFTNERRIEPSLDILARTQLKDYDISVQVSGGGSGKITTALTSDPPAPESDILAMLLTGRTLEQVRGHESEVAKDQVLSYLAGSAGAGLTSRLRKVTGISEVRIEPQLIQDEANPTARLTVGEDVTPKLSLIYSMNLVDSRDQIYIARYGISRRFFTQLTRQSDSSYRMELRQDLRLGGTRRRTDAADERVSRLIGKVHFLGEDYFGESKLRDRFKVKPDQKYDFFRIRNGLDRLEKMYSNAGLLESRVRLEKETQPRVVDLTVNITEGPKVQFVFEGWSVPGSVRDEVSKAWRDGVFDEQRMEDSKRRILTALLKDGRLDAAVEATVSVPREGERRVLFEIHPGERFVSVDVAFDGAKAFSTDALKKLLENAGLMTAIYLQPRKVTDLLEAYYNGRGYLAASVSPPRIGKNAATRTARILIPISEGPLFHVGNVEFSGNHAISSDTLQSALPLRSGGVYLPKLREDAASILRDLYGEQGYNRAAVASSLDLEAAPGKVNVKFTITENQQEVIEELAVRGNRYTSADLVLAQARLHKGDPVALGKLSAARRNLYNTGAFALVDVERTPLPSSSGGNRQPVRLTVRVREIQPWEIRYGGYYDTDRGPGGIADISNRNISGSARVIGMRYRHDAGLHELRPYFSQPLLKRFPLQTTASGYLRKEIMPGFITERQGFLLQQQARPARHYVLDYGYNIENARTYERNPDPLFPFDASLRFASLITSLTRETRDDLLDATRGSMISQSFEWGPSVLGSQIRYVRYFGQYFKFIPLSKPAPVPFSAIERSRVVFAGGVRAGFAGGLGGDEYPIAKRFFSGGGTTIRGFDFNSIGPRDALDNPEGGNAMIVLNGELRFPLFRMFDGVGFVDAGNVYRLAGGFDPGDMRKSAGFGLRVRTPYVLVRVDYGIKLDRRPGEGFGKLFFSIGQAF